MLYIVFLFEFMVKICCKILTFSFGNTRMYAWILKKYVGTHTTDMDTGMR